MSAPYRDWCFALAVLGGLPVALLYSTAAFLFIITGALYETGFELGPIALRMFAPHGREWASLVWKGETDEPLPLLVALRFVLWLPFALSIFAVHLVFGLLSFLLVLPMTNARVHFTMMRFLVWPFINSNSRKQYLAD